MRKMLLLIVVVGLSPAVQIRAEGEPDAGTREGWRRMSQLGSGFVVWESNRTGRWRLWRRELDGSGLRQISPEEPGRDHFCPHLAPDGKRLVYVSYPAGTDTYQEKAPQGGVPLHMMRADGTGDTQLTGSARAYSEDRAAVWLDNDNLIYIDGEGITSQLDVRNGKSSKITGKGQSGEAFGHGYLVNATRTHATTGVPTFSTFDASHSQINAQSELGGCQPYFSHDGKWGFWMGGAGGPINRIDLQSRQVSPILEIHDPRMPKDRSYLYFPMVSRDGRMFAFAASPNQHDHFTSDYDIFVAPMNPKTLEVVGEPVRYSFDKGCDRFPDVFLAESSLARKDEAPSTNPNPPASVAGAWPSNPDGLVFLFETADKPNSVPNADGQSGRSYPTQPRGRARLNHDYAMVLAGGSFQADEAADSLLAACRKSNQLSVEAVVLPDRLDQAGPARIITFSSSAASRDFTLGQQQDKLIFRLRTPKTGDNGYNPEITLCAIQAGVPSHVVVTYRPGLLAAYVDGKEVYHGESVQGDFSNWSPHHLVLGDEFDGSRDWAGTLEGVAIYDRALDPSEVQRNAAASHKRLQSRAPVQQVELMAKLVAKSPAPTLKEIKPYRQALMVSKYQVTKVLHGSLADREVLVAQWAILDGQDQPVTTLNPGAELRMVLEPSEGNPQLKRFVCKDGFDGENELLLPRYHDVTP